jgi:hypothetical protein
MAKNVNIKLGANITDFESKMKRAQKGFRRTAKNLKRIGKSMSLSLTAPLAAFAAASVKAFDTQAKAEAKLRTALGDNKEAFASLTNQARELQEITLFGDEETIAAQSFLAQMGLQEEAIKRLTPLIQDMATAKGMNLSAAADLVAKSVGSSTNALSRYGIQIEGAVGSTERLDSAVLALKNQFDGQAKAAAEAGTGSLKQLQNTIGDLAEDIGKMLMPVIQNLVDKIRIGVEKFKSLSDEQKENILQIGLLVAAIGPAVYILGTLATAVSGLATAFLFISGTAIPAVISALETLYLLMLYNPITAIALAVTALGASLYLLIDNLSDATDEQVKFNAAQAESIVLTEAQANALDSLVIPFVENVEKAVKRTRQLKTSLDEVAQVTHIAGPDSLEGGLIRVTQTLEEASDGMSVLGQRAMNTFSSIADRILQFRGTFKDVLTELATMLGKLILKAVIMGAVLSVLSGGAGGAGILGAGGGLSFGEAFTQSLTGRAGGGSVVAGQPYLVGESGPEVFMAGQSGTVIPNNNIGGGSVIPDVRISGNDLLIVFDKAQRRKERR